MAKDPCCFPCRGCLPLLVETLLYILVFFVAVVATIYPLIGG